MKRQFLWATLAVVTACGGSSYSSGTSGAPMANPTSVNPTATTPAGFVITIQNMGYTPVNLAVPAGATVTVVNLDGMPHSVTSEASAGSYTPGAPNGLAPFDTGAFSSGQKTITVPANAPAGTVIPFYCTVHKSTMTTPNGTITVDPNAKPATTTAPSPEPSAPPVGY